MQSYPVKNRHKTQPFVVGGCIIKKADKYLLVQEAKKDRGQWNQPAGWMDLGENLVEGAKREAEEETGLKIKVIGLLGIYSIIKPDDNEYGIKHAVKFIFATEPLSEEIKVDQNEILQAKWFTLSEIKSMKKELRDIDIIAEVESYEQGKIFPIQLAENFCYQLDN